jgi:hypothetical protein
MELECVIYMIRHVSWSTRVCVRALVGTFEVEFVSITAKNERDTSDENMQTVLCSVNLRG